MGWRPSNPGPPGCSRGLLLLPDLQGGLGLPLPHPTVQGLTVKGGSSAPLGSSCVEDWGPGSRSALLPAIPCTRWHGGQVCMGHRPPIWPSWQQRQRPPSGHLCIQPSPTAGRRANDYKPTCPLPVLGGIYPTETCKVADVPSCPLWLCL